MSSLNGRLTRLEKQQAAAELQAATDLADWFEHYRNNRDALPAGRAALYDEIETLMADFDEYSNEELQAIVHGRH